MKKVTTLATLALGVLQAFSQSIGLIQHSAQSLDDGYVLFAPITSNTVFLIDKCGKQVKTWNSAYKPGQSVYLLQDGNLLHTGNANNNTFNAGGKGGVIEKIDWNGNVVWSYTVSDAGKCQHHDAKALPNGNILVIAWESKTGAQAIAAGRNPTLVPSTLWSEQILEIQPVGTNSGNIVWEWHLWDHLVQDFDNTKSNYGTVASSQQLVNLNFNASATNSDWIHLNSIDYNPSLDQILLSSHALSEVWVIDHSTTSAQAASHAGGNSGMGGDIIYRWGNPQSYNKGSAADQKFFGQHNAYWIENGLPNAGQIMVFNNGLNRTGGNYSTAEIINPPYSAYTYSNSLPYLPAGSSWIYNAGNTHSYYAQNISSAQQLSNGSVLLSNGPAGDFTEVDASGNTIWEYINPVSATGIMAQNSTPTQNLSFRCTFYPASFSGFSGKTLSSGSIIENSNTVSASCNLLTALENIQERNALQVFPNPCENYLTVSLPGKTFDVLVYNANGDLLYTKQRMEEKMEMDVSALPAGVYLLRIKTKDQTVYNKKISVR